MSANVLLEINTIRDEAKCCMRVYEEYMYDVYQSI